MSSSSSSSSSFSYSSAWATSLIKKLNKKKGALKTVRAHPYPLRNRCINGRIDTTSVVAPKCIDCSNSWTLAGYLRCADCHFVYENPSYGSEWRTRTFETIDEKGLQEFDAIKGTLLKREMFMKHLPVLRAYWEQKQALPEPLVCPYEGSPFSASHVAPTFFALVPSVYRELDLELETSVTEPERCRIKDLYRTRFIQNLKKQSSGPDVRRLIRTCYEGRGFLFWAHEADDLIAHFYNRFGKEGTQSNRLMHAIGPYMYDVWNCRCSDSNFLCYYKDFGDLTRIPTRTKDLFKLWDTCNDPMYYGFSH